MCSRHFVGVLPLVAGLFVLVEGLNRTGVLGVLSQLLQTAAEKSVTEPRSVREPSWHSPAT